MERGGTIFHIIQLKAVKLYLSHSMPYNIVYSCKVNFGIIFNTWPVCYMYLLNNSLNQSHREKEKWRNTYISATLCL